MGDESVAKLWDALLEEARNDSRLCSLLLVCVCAVRDLPLVPNGGLWDLVRRFPESLEVPGLPVKIGRALDDVEANRDLYALSLKRLQAVTSSLSQKTLKQQRRGRAVAVATLEATRHEAAPDEAM